MTSLQSAPTLPVVPRVPAPWALCGHAWIVLLHLPRRAPARTAFVPDALRGSLRAAVSALMCVEYTSAPCGAYREVLFVPGTLRFPDGRRHASISRILVSTWASVVNGRANWGIPKDRADFSIERGELTPTMKIRRTQVLQNFRQVVSELYLGKEEVA